MGPSYRHTQVGWVILTVVGIIAVGTMVSALARPSPIASATVGILVLCLSLFSTLTVRGGPDGLDVRFGPGLIRRKLAWSDIRSASPVRNSWLTGWGIRWIRHGWLFNVSGYKAVELRLKSGRVFRIGTDDPSGLHAFIQQYVKET